MDGDISRTEAGRVSGGYFGARWPCFGMLHAPEHPRFHGVLVVNDFGTRAIDAYWTFRRLAEQLSCGGSTVLRFDLPGTGDSPAIQGNRVDAWAEAVESAVAHLLALGIERLTVIGYGVGAILALNASFRNPAVHTAELIQPFLSGERYLAFVDPEPTSSRPVDGGRFVSSHFLGHEEERSLRALVPTFSNREPPLDVDLLQLGEDDAAGFQERLLATGHGARLHRSEDYGQWLKDPVYNEIPEFFEGIVRRVSRMATGTGTARRVPLRTRHEAPDHTHVEEVVTCAGLDDQPLHGVLAMPTRPPEHAGLVLILGTAANRRSGMHDNGTFWARALAAGGIPTLRFDASGFGDSPPRSGFRDNEVLVDRNYTDAEPWLAELEKRGFVDFGGMGVSSGGFNAFTLCQRNVAVIALFGINVARFVEIGFEQAVREDIRPSSTYWRLLREPETWKRLLRGRIQVRRIGVVLMDRLGGRVRNALSLRLGRLRRETTIGAAHRDMLGFLARPGAAVRLVCCEGDQWLENFEKEFGPRAAVMAGHPGFAVTFLQNVDHGISDPQEAARVGELARAFFASTFARAAAARAAANSGARAG